MSVKVIDPEPQRSAVKQIVCPHCGALLEYVPNDIKQKQTKRDYLGDSETYRAIDCPLCKKDIPTP